MRDDNNGAGARTRAIVVTRSEKRHARKSKLTPFLPGFRFEPRGCMERGRERESARTAAIVPAEFFFHPRLHSAPTRSRPFYTSHVSNIGFIFCLARQYTDETRLGVKQFGRLTR